jgi:catechol 2,3-dioxygenase-like lactoylglutathione lyase family enzyme
LRTKVIVEGTYVEFETEPATLAAYRADLMQEVLADSGLPSGGGVVIVVRVPDVDAAYAELRSRGNPFVTEPHDQERWGLRVCHLRDPDGHVLELYQLLTEPSGIGGRDHVGDP